MRPYSLLQYSTGEFGIEIPSTFTGSGTLMADAGNTIPVEREIVFFGNLFGLFNGRRGSLAPASDHAYDLLRYSINPGGRMLLPGECIFVTSLGAVAGAAIPMDSNGTFFATLSGELNGTIAAQSAFQADTELNTTASMSANVLSEPKFEYTLQHRGRGSKNFVFSAQFEDNLNVKSKIGKNLISQYLADGVIKMKSFASKNIQREYFASDALLVLADAYTMQTETATIEIAIPPGAELRIDSDIFIVTLNGENILYAQIGDWINVSRDLLRLNIESATGGNLSGSLVYTERYL